MQTRVFIGLGANLGDGLDSLPRAWARLGQCRGVVPGPLSSPYRTVPQGMESGNMFINAVGELTTELVPEELLTCLVKVEKEWGRIRGNSGRYQDRPLDLDILFFADEVIDTPGLAVPHPRCGERLFVLAPLAELAPDFRHPLLGQSIRDLLARCLATPAGRAAEEGMEKCHWPAAAPAMAASFGESC